MFKKFLWFFIAVVFLCSPLWAEDDNPWNSVLNDYLFASADQKQPPAQSQAPEVKILHPLTSSRPEQPASPLDVCLNTNKCFDQPNFTACLVGGLQPNTKLYSFQDPGNVCPPVAGCPIYPFEVKNVHVLLTECNFTTQCVAVVQPTICSAVYPTPNCPVPGNVICTGKPVEIIIQPTLCQEYIFPIDPTCCVSGPYFACLTILTTDCFSLSLCLDTTCTPCCNYVDSAGLGLQEWCAKFPPFARVGDFSIWTDGAYSCQNICPAPPDTLRNHFKTWRIQPVPIDTFALVRDQFTTFDPLKIDTIDFLSNPVRKIVFGPTNNDTSEITRPNDHLTWYRAKGKPVSLQVAYKDQFESTKVFIDSVKYFLLPTQKDPHPRPDSLLGHYTAYKIRNPKGFLKNFLLQDQFDFTPEVIDSLVPRYFLTPAQKNNEPQFGPDTHYVAYEIFSQRVAPQPRTTTDQFGVHSMQIFRAEMLLVPTRKDTFVVCTYKPNDCNGDGVVNLADIICDVNVVFKGFVPPVPKCRCDSDCNGVCNLVDIVYKKNYVFGGGPQPVPCKECCKPLP
ncbi:MAG: hypothetical protein RBG1_1C00001G1279 [candidate division Zixibacteria bacterium RBG-1]|nr:MAG: hypothetical protein RBG1_1C00001G1279 [candidate division Zixibacteria bacterium RBG-1]